MKPADYLQVGVFLAVLLILVRPLGNYMARVMTGEVRFLARVETLLYRLCGIRPDDPMTWQHYGAAFLAFNFLGTLAVYVIARLQGYLPWNPQGFGPVDTHTAWNIAVSFATNTNWQNYGGETTLSYFTQMAALTVQNFVSAACGIAVLAALARAIASRTSKSIGNFWSDLVRSTLYILVPLSLVLAVVLVWQGVIQNFDGYAHAGAQTIPMGPAASQIAIKQLGTNGGGFFNANSAHPFENPTPLTNFLEMLALVLIPAALCQTFGKMVGDARQGWALLAAMLVIFLPLLAMGLAGEFGAGAAAMEGKEVRFGVVNSTLWGALTTAASNGSVNAMHDSFSPLGGLMTLFLMQLGEVIFGGVGSGVYGMVIFAILSVFLAGLMVGRTPEYLGKKIEAFDMKMVSIAILIPPLCVLVGTAIGVVTPMGLSGLQNHGPHGFSEILYAFTSMGNNNGSAFGGYGPNNWLVNIVGGIAMLLSRYWIAVPVIALAGSLAGKKIIPTGAGTLPTHTPLFIALLASVVVIVGALAFIPALALGPIVEQLRFAAVAGVR